MDEPPPKSAFELEREQRIAHNKRKIAELGIGECLRELQVPTPAKVPRAKRQNTDVADIPGEIRRSSRPKQAVNYADDVKPERPPPKDQTHKIAAVQLDEETAERLRAEAEAKRVAVPEGSATPAKKRAPIDSGKGVRIQGGKVYDSKYGVTCHWCRQKTLEDHVTCTHPNCGRGKRLPTTFCKKCLLNRHGEDSEAADASGKWVCPQCRGSCGPGCVVCCNCGPCRKKAGLEPTHQIVKLARDAKFTNVHDYLVHLVTGESAEKIAGRKQGFWWGEWLKDAGSSGADNSDASAQTADELPAAEEEQEQDEEAPVVQPRRVAAKGSKGAGAAAATAKGVTAARRGGGRATGSDQAKGNVAAEQDCCANKSTRPAPKPRVKRAPKAAGAKAKGTEAAEVPAAEPKEQQQEEEEEREQQQEGEAVAEVPLSQEEARKARKQRMMQRMGLGPLTA